MGLKNSKIQDRDLYAIYAEWPVCNKTKTTWPNQINFVTLIHDNILMNRMKTQPIAIWEAMCNICSGWWDNKKNKKSALTE